MTFSDHVVRAYDAGKYQLLGAGSDNAFGTDDDVVIPLSASYTNRVATLTFPALTGSYYRPSPCSMGLAMWLATSWMATRMAQRGAHGFTTSRPTARQLI